MSLHCVPFRSIALHFLPSHFIAFHAIPFLCVALHCIPLRCISLHYSTYIHIIHIIHNIYILCVFFVFIYLYWFIHVKYICTYIAVVVEHANIKGVDSPMRSCLKIHGGTFGQVQWRGGRLVSLNLVANSLAYGITWLATSKPPKKIVLMEHKMISSNNTGDMEIYIYINNDTWCSRFRLPAQFPLKTLHVQHPHCRQIVGCVFEKTDRRPGLGRWVMMQWLPSGND